MEANTLRSPMKAMTPRRREKLLRVMDGKLELTVYLWHWNQHRRCDQILDWLIQNRLTGGRLSSWISGQFRGSILEPLRHILQRIDRDPEPKPVIVGTDYGVA
jgi:hypothetical protein